MAVDLDEIFTRLKTAYTAYTTARQDYNSKRNALETSRGVLDARREDVARIRKEFVDATDPERQQ